jgi:VanZ family protein
MKFEQQYLVVLSTLVIFFGSILPLPHVSGSEEVSYAIHLLLYVICSFSWAQFLKSRRRYAALMMALTPVTEILQLPLPYRTPCAEDLIANIVGTILGFILSHMRH